MSSTFEKYVTETFSKLHDPGLLLVSRKNNGKCNVMTIDWGFVGVFWLMPIFVVAVRPSRYTHEFIDDSGEFTVNVPNENMDKVVKLCGRVSGREHDKIKECKLTFVEGKKVKVPVIEECNVRYECKVVHKLEVNPDLVPADVKRRFYPKHDYSTLYFGEILQVY